MAGETESLYEFSSGSVFSIVGSSDKNLRHDGPGGAGENSPGSSDPGKPTNKTTCTPDGVREMNVARGCSLKYSRTPSGVHGILENQKPRVYRPWAICLHPIRGDNTCGLMLVFPMIGKTAPKSSNDWKLSPNVFFIAAGRQMVDTGTEHREETAQPGELV